MILTYKHKHGLNFTSELDKAKKIANFAIQTRNQSSKTATQFGLPSVISCQILRRNGFYFKRVDGTMEHSGVNAAFNIAMRQPLSNLELDGRTKSPKSHKLKVGDMSPFMSDILRHQSLQERDCKDGSTDTPQGAML